MNKKIMIVDDDPDILISLRSVFEHHHFEVLAVDSGRDCIKELEKGFRGIIFMDLIMPFMDGWDTLREIIDRGLNDDILIFIITAIGNPNSEKIRGLESYIYDYIPKPFDLKKILSEINAITVTKKIKKIQNT
jgi:DNA-binding response OmpR family regulator